MLKGIIPIPNRHPGIMIDTRVSMSALIDDLYCGEPLDIEDEKYLHTHDSQGFSINYDQIHMGRAFTVPSMYKYLTIHFDLIYGYTTNLIVLTDPLDGPTSLGNAYLIAHRQTHNMLTTFHRSSLLALIESRDIQIDWHSFPMNFPFTLENMEQDIYWSYATVDVKKDFGEKYLEMIDFRDADAAYVAATCASSGPDVVYQEITESLCAVDDEKHLSQRISDEITSLFVRGMQLPNWDGRTGMIENTAFQQVVGKDIEDIPIMHDQRLISYTQAMVNQITSKLNSGEQPFVFSGEMIFYDRLLVFLSRYPHTAFANSVFEYTTMTDTYRHYVEDEICPDKSFPGRQMVYQSDKESFINIFKKNLREIGCLEVTMIITFTHDCLIQLNFTNGNNILLYVDLTWLYLGTLSIFDDRLLS